MALRPVSVTQLNEYISRVLTTDPLLGNIAVVGEITNLKYHSTGHVYFSIVDEGSKVNCFLPASYAEALNYQLGDGLEIIVRGYINVYKKGGTYTLFVRSIEVSGEGNLAMAFELLKEKLSKEGLFDTKYKKPLPQFPRKVGIVTSETGAAVKDIIKIIKQRTNLVDIMVFPVPVQGEGAAAEIAAMIGFINKEFIDDIEVLIVGRGGGSMEDLWAFNEEAVARAIFDSRIPVISAVGHEIDFTISDFAADRRAETPTAAAEMAVPDSQELTDLIEGLKNSLLTQLNSKIKYDRLLLDGYLEQIRNNLYNLLGDYKHILEKNKVILDENNPKKVLSKGFAMVEDNESRVVTSVNLIKDGQTYKLYLKDGAVSFTVSDVMKAGD